MKTCHMCGQDWDLPAEASEKKWSALVDLADTVNIWLENQDEPWALKQMMAARDHYLKVSSGKPSKPKRKRVA